MEADSSSNIAGGISHKRAVGWDLTDAIEAGKTGEA